MRRLSPNGATLIAYFILTAGVVAQIARTYSSGRAEDIAIVEVVGRFVAQILLMWKMCAVADKPLIWGHFAVTVTYLVYFVLVIGCKYF